MDSIRQFVGSLGLIPVIAISLLASTNPANAQMPTKLVYPAKVVCHAESGNAGFVQFDKGALINTVTSTAINNGFADIYCDLPWNRDLPIKVIKVRVAANSTAGMECDLIISSDDVNATGPLYFDEQSVPLGLVPQSMKFVLPTSIAFDSSVNVQLFCFLPSIDTTLQNPEPSAIKAILINN